MPSGLQREESGDLHAFLVAFGPRVGRARCLDGPRAAPGSGHGEQSRAWQQTLKRMDRGLAFYLFFKDMLPCG